MKNSNDTIGNRTRDLPACSAVPQPTAPTSIPQPDYRGGGVKRWGVVLSAHFHFVPVLINRLKPNDQYLGRTALLTSKPCILYIYSTNVGTEYFKHALYSPFFFSSKCSLFHNANLFDSCIIHILYTGCAKIKKK